MHVTVALWLILLAAGPLISRAFTVLHPHVPAGPACTLSFSTFDFTPEDGNRDGDLQRVLELVETMVEDGHKSYLKRSTSTETKEQYEELLSICSKYVSFEHDYTDWKKDNYSKYLPEYLMKVFDVRVVKQSQEEVVLDVPSFGAREKFFFYAHTGLECTVGKDFNNEDKTGNYSFDSSKRGHLHVKANGNCVIEFPADDGDTDLKDESKIVDIEPSFLFRTVGIIVFKVASSAKVATWPTTVHLNIDQAIEDFLMDHGTQFKGIVTKFSSDKRTVRELLVTCGGPVVPEYNPCYNT